MLYKLCFYYTRTFSER